MADYSYTDLHGMRDDAIRRVREMQRQAMAVTEAEKAPQNAEKKTKEATSDDVKATKKEAIPGEPHDSQKGQINNKKRQGSSNQKKQAQLKEILENKEISEEMLLLSVAALLLSEKCDTVLVLAIIYILYA
ncbi:MAG: hypothetical protein Q4A45_02555 [Clostridia bacterium]|nr:hypothetical protein [Clostridia bacterium]